MMITKIDINEFDYPLADHKIARFPLDKRDHSKLLVYRHESIEQTQFYHLPSLLNEGGLLVFNNTKVVPARLLFTKSTGAVIEILCLEPIVPASYQQMFSQVGKARWKCMVGNAKRWKEATLSMLFKGQGQEIRLHAAMVEKLQDGYIIEFHWNENVTFAEILAYAGHVPIPPYLTREEEAIDRDRYQTVYSMPEGSVAAPTAGLHFTDALFEDLKNKNIQCEFLTLHVGAGTFLPVKTDDARQHVMHRERFLVLKKAVQNIINHLGNITAVGTTSVRTLETLYWLGVKTMMGTEDLCQFNQWEAYELPQDIAPEEALKSLLSKMDSCLEADTGIMIVPGYQFRVVNRLITNFHQPRSTLLLLVSAFVGLENWKKIYDYAIHHDFRFLSYGDSSLLMP